MRLASYAILSGRPSSNSVKQSSSCQTPSSSGCSRKFIERGRHEASADIAHVAKLTTRDYELLAKLAPYEDLTVKEIALTRLMPNDFQDDDIAEIEDGIHADLLTLAQRGILKVQDCALRPYG